MTCKRHKADKSVEPDWRPVSSGKLWAIAVIPRCVKCGQHMSPRVVIHTVKPTQREAMAAYDEKLEREFAAAGLFPEPAKSEPIEAPLTGWPFRESSRDYHLLK